VEIVARPVASVEELRASLRAIRPGAVEPMGWAWMEALEAHLKRMKRTMKQVYAGAASLTQEEQALVVPTLARMQEYARLVALGEGR